MSYDAIEDDSTWRALAWRTAVPLDLPNGLQGPHLGASLRNAVPYLQFGGVGSLPRRMDDVAKLLQAAADELTFLEVRLAAVRERDATAYALRHIDAFPGDPEVQMYRITNRSGSELHEIKAVSPEGAMAQFIAAAGGRDAVLLRREQWEAGEWTVAPAPSTSLSAYDPTAYAAAAQERPLPLNRDALKLPPGEVGGAGKEPLAPNPYDVWEYMEHAEAGLMRHLARLRDESAEPETSLPQDVAPVGKERP